MLFNQTVGSGEGESRSTSLMNRRRLPGGSSSCGNGGVATRTRFSPKVRARAARLVQAQAHASRRAAITANATKIGCAQEPLRLWLQQAERDAGVKLSRQATAQVLTVAEAAAAYLCTHLDRPYSRAWCPFGEHPCHARWCVLHVPVTPAPCRGRHCDQE